MNAKNRKISFIVTIIALIFLIFAWFRLDKDQKINDTPLVNDNNPVASTSTCTSYSPDTCPGNCVVCPPCPECSSISCQSEEFCAGFGIDRTWYEKIKSGLEGKVCGRENCHGLDIKCGSHPAEICTAMYALGDKCLQYAKCGLVDGNCQFQANEAFNSCKACVDDCLKKNPDDSIKAFDCEAKCQ